MKKLSIVFLLMLTMSCTQTKIGFVDNELLLKEYTQRIDLEEKYKLQYEEFNAKFDTIEVKFKEAAQKLITEAKTASQKQNLEQRLGQERSMLAQQYQTEQQKIQKASQTEIDSMIKKVNNYIIDYGKKNNYDLLFGKTQTNNLYYGKEALNITSTVLASLNSDYQDTKDNSADKKEEVVK